MSTKTDTIPKSIKAESADSPVVPDEAEIVRRILRALAGVEYGSVEIIVQDSKVVQIERTQRSRFPQPLDIPRV